MASGTKKKGASKKAVKSARNSVVTRKHTPWGTIIAVIAVVALAAVVVSYYLIQSAPKRALADWTPSASNPDPSLKIPGIVTATYKGSVHVLPTERVAYDHFPPIGGPHDGYWATCNGTVYKTAVRNENMVHALEHGSVWIAYNPDEVKGDALTKLTQKIQGKQNSMISPYPGLDMPISLQSWGHQLKVDNADDARIDEFITALRANPNTTPEIGASCDALGAGEFDPDNPPPFDATAPGPNAKPMTYTGSSGAQQEGGASTVPSTATSK